MFLAVLAPAMHQDRIYAEPLRPQFHFTSRTGWLNDPNGLVYFGGEYHLFFQHNPFGTQWGNMTWGHAVSRDLVHWRQIDNAIEPDSLGTIFSGSAVVDSRNTSRLGRAGSPALVCIYTAAGGTNDASKGKPFSQCLAFSLDGRTFAKPSFNPVLPHIEAENRDPKVIWHEATHRWVMALYLDGSRYALLSSPDLRNWTRMSEVEIPGAGECPDIFALPLDGDGSNLKWVFWGGNGLYRVGRFDGTRFSAETPPLASNFGNTGYAAQTYFNDPKGRRVQIAWHNNSDFPDAPWNQEMGFPNELRLVATQQGPRLRIWPVAEIASLREKRTAPEADGSYRVPGGLMDVTVSFRPKDAGTLAMKLNGVEVRYDGSTHELSCLDKRVPVEPIRGSVRLRVLVDRASLEIYAQDGLTCVPMFTLAFTGERGVRITNPGAWRLAKVEVRPLRSAWAAN